MEGPRKKINPVELLREPGLREVGGETKEAMPEQEQYLRRRFKSHG
jgi:hypothetical protein